MKGEFEGCSFGAHHPTCPEHGMMARWWKSPKLVLKIALFKAKVHILEEKLRPKLEAELGADLDKVADAIVQAVVKKRRAKIEIMKQTFELKDKLKEIFFEGDEEEEEN